MVGCDQSNELLDVADTSEDVAVNLGSVAVAREPVARYSAVVAELPEVIAAESVIVAVLSAADAEKTTDVAGVPVAVAILQAMPMASKMHLSISIPIFIAMKRFFYLLSVVLWPFLSNGQGQKIDLPAYGVSFEIPEGWVAQMEDDYILMGHQTIPGLIIIFENTAATPEELKKSAEEGLYDEGVSLQPESTFSIEENKVSGYYTGQFQGSQVKAYAVGLISRVGSGFTAVVLTETGVFSDTHVKEMDKLVGSVHFKEISGTYSTDQWKGWLIGSQLRYMYTSGGSDYGGGYSGTSQDTRINLCSNGKFLYYSSSSSSFDGSGGFGYAHGSDDSTGKYKIYGNAGRSFLRLSFANGEITEYEITTNDQDHTLLNDYRYFVVGLEGCN